MSLSYAHRLAHRKDLGGALGQPEVHEDAESWSSKCETLARWWSDAQHVVVYTGAGVSTSCGIPDFRGPQGIWTKQRRGEAMPTCDVGFGFATPSLTHRAIAQLVRMKRVDYVASQNVDGIHARTGLDREKLAELHGNCFSERCKECKKVHLRDFEMKTVGFKYTRRKCDGCGGRLTDNILDWESPLPEDELDATIQHTERADLVVCMGTSLRITPVCDLPEQVQSHGGKLVIVNLQETPKDHRADLVIHAKCDQVMALLLKHMEVKVPPYIRVDKARISYHVLFPTSAHHKPFDLGVRGSGIKLIFSSIHHPKCPLPFVQSLRVELEGEVQVIETTSKVPLIATFHRKVYVHEVLVFRVQVRFVEQLGAHASSVEYTVHGSAITSNLFAGDDGGLNYEFRSQALPPAIPPSPDVHEDHSQASGVELENVHKRRRTETT